jgi:hypothetical protein
MERSFAGFWRDGAVVQPEDRHADATGYVIGFSKSRKELYCCHAMRPLIWSEYYWLDTTTPTELTPQEAFELLKVISPTTSYIEPRFGCEWIKAEPFKSIINWGDTTEYPPKQKWRVPTDADKGKECRCKHRHDDEWKYGRVFITEFEGKYLAKDLSDNSHRRYAMCEVLDE